MKRIVVTNLPEPQQEFLHTHKTRLAQMASSLHWRYMAQSFGNQYTHEDLLQEGLLAMFKATSWPDIADQDHMFTWAFAYIKRRAITLCTGLSKQQEACYQYTLQDHEGDNLPSLVSEVLRVAKATLKPRNYQLICMRAEGMSGAEIAAQLGLGEVRVRGIFLESKATILAKGNWL